MTARDPGTWAKAVEGQRNDAIAENRLLKSELARARLALRIAAGAIRSVVRDTPTLREALDGIEDALNGKGGA
jgi:hypothetical protein